MYTFVLWSFTSQDSDIFLHSFCADSSSPQISAILVGHLTQNTCILRKSPQFKTSRINAQNNINILACKIP